MVRHKVRFQGGNTVKFKKAKKLLAGMLAGALVVPMALTGCGAGSAEDKKDTGKKDTKESREESAELKFLVPGYDGGYLKEQLDSGIAAFEKENPDIKVNIESVGWEDLNSKILQLYQSGEAPDLMLTGTRTLRQLSELGAVEDLTPYMTDDFKSRRVENVLDTAKINGKQYGIPMAFSSRALFYRKDLIKTPPKNWDELFDTAKKVHEEHPDVYGFAIPTDYEAAADEVLNFFYQNKGRLVDKKGDYTFDTPENVEALSYLAKFGKEGIVPDPISTKRGDQSKLFSNGDLAMFVSGPWEFDQLNSSKDKFPYGIAVLPEGKVPAVTLVTDDYVMSSLSKHKEAAWKFIEFMGQTEYQRPVSEAFGWFPILKDEESDERFTTEAMKPFAERIKDGVPEPKVPDWDSFNKVFMTAVQKAVSGEETPQKALKDAQSEISK